MQTFIANTAILENSQPTDSGGTIQDDFAIEIITSVVQTLTSDELIKGRIVVRWTGTTTAKNGAKSTKAVFRRANSNMLLLLFIGVRQAKFHFFGAIVVVIAKSKFLIVDF